MAKRKKTHPGSALATVLGGLALAAACLWWLAGSPELSPEQLAQQAMEYLSQPVSSSSQQQEALPPAEGELRVHMIDVGQGDSILIQTAEEAVLIDSGEAEYGDTVSDYLKSQGVEKLDLVMATHPHSDHMGSMAQIVADWPVEEFMMPIVPESLTPTSRVYENLLDALEEKELSITQPEAGTVYDLGSGARLTILAPVGEDYDNLNDWSIVCRVDFGETSFLFTGDSEKPVERDLLESGALLDADLLKVGHHGSSTSTGKTFLRAVSPDTAFISCGIGNRYGHPNQSTLDTLEEEGVEIWRTDISGSVVAVSDGSEISIISQR